jgi:putative endonuclease
MYFVYLLVSPSSNKRYVGSTNDLQKRLIEHNSGRSKYTSTEKDWQMFYWKSFEKEAEARSYEHLVKRNKKYRKLFYEEAGNYPAGLPV